MTGSSAGRGPLGPLNQLHPASSEVPMRSARRIALAAQRLQAHAHALLERPVPLVGLLQRELERGLERDLLAVGFRPGPELGRTMRRLEERWIASDFALDASALLEMARLIRRDAEVAPPTPAPLTSKVLETA